MWIRSARTAWVVGFLVLILSGPIWLSDPRSAAADDLLTPPELPGRLISQVNGKKHQAQVFPKGNRRRLKHQYAVRTVSGRSVIEIIRRDQFENWYCLARQQELWVTQVNPSHVLATRHELPMERSGTLVGDVTVAGRAHHLFDIRIDPRGEAERFHARVDVKPEPFSTWSVESVIGRLRYERVRFSPQPGNYFDE